MCKTIYGIILPPYFASLYFSACQEVLLYLMKVFWRMVKPKSKKSEATRNVSVDAGVTMNPVQENSEEKKQTDVESAVRIHPAQQVFDDAISALKYEKYYVALQLCHGMVIFFSTLSQVCSEPYSSSWDRYSVFYGRIVNSSVVYMAAQTFYPSNTRAHSLDLPLEAGDKVYHTLGEYLGVVQSIEDNKVIVADDKLETRTYHVEELLTDLHKQFAAEIDAIRSPLYILWLLIVPATITHLVASAILYIWVDLLVITGVVVGLVVAIAFCSPCVFLFTTNVKTYREVLQILQKVALHALVGYIYGSSFNYAYLFYQSDASPSAYIHVISHEYDLRTEGSCYYYKEFNDFIDVLRNFAT